MAYGSVLTDTVQSSTAATAPVFKDGNGTQIGTLCRAWVNFDGVTTATIRASFNVSSVTRTSAGYYTVSFTTALTDANYAVCSIGSSAAGVNGNNIQTNTTSTKTSSQYFLTNQVNNVVQDPPSGGYISIAVFR